ncbi:MAG: ATP-dependent protease subunit HslV [Planctomycetota bacterium]|jgi:ATP-dependent HslUV protease subunit HslV
MTIKATTILSVRKGKKVAIAGDGQVTLGNEVMKHTANKIRKIAGGKVVTGFAGSAADAFALMERFEKRLDEYNDNLVRAATELAKEWRMDRALRRLESMMIVADKDTSLLLGGSGDVIESDDGVLAIGSGGGYAAAAARALINHTKYEPVKIVEEALKVAGNICIYTNTNITVEEL